MFFFSSRRRHTRWPRDWSSDVALPIYSDNLFELTSHTGEVHYSRTIIITAGNGAFEPRRLNINTSEDFENVNLRSEERRVGKECRLRRARDEEERKVVEAWCARWGRRA